MISDTIYHDPSNQSISSEYRAFKQIFQFVQSIDSLYINTDEASYIIKNNQSSNMLQYIVPIPRETEISSQYINLNPLQTEQKLKIKLRTSSNNTDYSKFYPQNTRIIWLIGDKNVANKTDSKTIIYIHGGSYIFGGASHLGFASHLSIATQTRVAYVCYDVPPKVSIPYQVDQILTVYFYLTLIMEIAPRRIVIAGDSAGGGLSLLFIQKLGLNKLQHLYPNGVVAISPWSDLGLNGASYERNKEMDVIINVETLRRSGKIVSGYDEKNFENAFYSALYGPILNQLPKMYFIVSKHETLFDDSEKLKRKFMRDTENKVVFKYEVKEYMCHDWLLFIGLFPEADQSFHKVVETIIDWYTNH